MSLHDLPEACDRPGARRMSLSDTPATAVRDMPPFEAPALPRAADPGERDTLRARFLRAGRDAVDDRELLQLLLAGSHSAAEAEDLAGILLDTFGSPARVLATRPDTLRAAAGLGDAAIAAIKTAEALGIRLARAELPARFHAQLATYDKVIDYCRTLTAHREVEELHLLFLDNRNALIRDERHQRGTLNHTPAYPREICIRALEVGASALVILHNHPGGDPTPSRADVEMTNRIRDALKPIDVTLHDHVVVTAGAAFSFREKGLI